MARISLSELAEKAEEKIHFSFGNASFSLEKNGVYETDDPGVIADANSHPDLEVEHDAAPEGESPEEVAKAVEESRDPHVNPRADHLSANADPEVVKEAQERSQAIRDEVQANAPIQQAQVDEPQAPSASVVLPSAAEQTELTIEEHTD